MFNFLGILSNLYKKTTSIGFLLFLGLTLLFSSCKKEKTSLPQYGKAPAVSSKQVCRVSIVAVRKPIKIMEDYQPLMDYLHSKVPSLQFVMEPSLDYEGIVEKYRTKGVELLFVNPLQTLGAIKSGYKVIAMSGIPGETRRIVVARKDSNLVKPTDLKSKTVSYASPTAIGAILVQDFLHGQGLDTNNDFVTEYVGSQDAVFQNVYRKKSVAGAAYPRAWILYQRDHPKEASELKIIWKTAPFIGSAVMVRNDIPEQIQFQIQKSLLALRTTAKGRRILETTDFDNLYMATDKDYDIVKTFLAKFEKEVRKVEIK